MIAAELVFLLEFYSLHHLNELDYYLHKQTNEQPRIQTKRIVSCTVSLLLAPHILICTILRVTNLICRNTVTFWLVWAESPNERLTTKFALQRAITKPLPEFT